MILAGGAGTRFWPASRRSRPKHFVPLVGGLTPLEETLRRLRGLAPARRTWIVTTRELGARTRRALRGHRGVRLLLEPEARNTSAAVLWAAARVGAEDPDGLVGIFPADHHIPSARGFLRSVRAAARAAADGESLVLLGIQPDRPDTAYGYLQLGERAGGAAYRVRRFVEKPDRIRARRFLRSGHYLWNAGMLISRPDRILAEAEREAPEVWSALGPVLERIRAGARVPAPAFARAYRRAAPLSFDYAVLERSRSVRAVRGRFRWSDLGSWDALEAHLESADGNAFAGAAPAASIDSDGNVIWNTTDRAVALLGVHGLVVVETQDALLVCAKDRAQEVRKVVGELARRRHHRKLT